MHSARTFDEAKRGKAARRILFVQKYSSLGGSQVSLVHHLELLDRSRFDPIVVVSNTGWLTSKLDELGIPWSTLDFGHWTNLLSIPRNIFLIRKLHALMKRERVALVHANEHWVGPVALYAARLAGVPAICHFRTGLSDLTRLRVWKYRYGRFDRVIAVAQVLADTMRRYVAKPERIVVIRDGVLPPDVQPRYRRKSSRTVVINVGALYEVKGQAKILDLAMPWLQGGRRRYLVFVGGTRTSPSYVDDMKRLVAKHGLQRQVLFLGNREDVPRLLELADALVAYSTVEGVPRVVMEAMFAGRPVIVSDTPGMEEVVSDGENGRILNFDDPSNPLAEALRNLSDAPDRWQALGRRANEMARKKYSTEAMSTAIQSIYRELLEHGAHARTSA